MRDMDIPPGNLPGLPGLPGSALAYDEGIRRELDEILDRLGRVIGRRLTLKGISEADAFLLVAEALLELARQLPRVEDRDRWLIEFLDLGPYDPESLAREAEMESLQLEAELRAKAAEARRQQAMGLERRPWPGTRKRSAAEAKRRSSGNGGRWPRPLDPL